MLAAMPNRTRARSRDDRRSGALQPAAGADGLPDDVAIAVRDGRPDAGGLPPAQTLPPSWFDIMLL